MEKMNAGGIFNTSCEVELNVCGVQYGFLPLDFLRFTKAPKLGVVQDKFNIIWAKNNFILCSLLRRSLCTIYSSVVLSALQLF